MSLKLQEISGMDFRTSQDAETLNTKFRQRLGFSVNFGPARLAIARSLGIADQPKVTEYESYDLSKPIKGHTLFGTGSELATWIALFVEHAELKQIGKKDLQSLVGAHWHRGIKMLEEDWKNSKEDFDTFIVSLMERAGIRASGGSSTMMQDEDGNTVEEDLRAIPVDLQLGDPATDISTGEVVNWRINGKGNSPHIAVMGTLGTGKTRVAMQMLRQIKDLTGCPILMFDMGKGDLADNSELCRALDAEVIRVPNEPIPFDVMQVPDKQEATLTSAAIRFRDSFARMSKSKMGGVQSDALREAAIRALKKNKKNKISDIRDSLKDLYSETGKKDDVLTSTFNDLCAYQLFDPKLSPVDFFKKSWVIDVHAAEETTQRLIVFMMLDAVDAYLTKINDSPIDGEGNRALRLMVVIDEARKVLGYSQPSLINIVRTARSKGGSVVMISQSPDDFAQEKENFLENIGLSLCFRTNAQSSALKAVLGEKVDLGALQNGVMVTRLPSKRGVMKVQAWE
jgi:DNA sulfur modification protein DndE